MSEIDFSQSQLVPAADFGNTVHAGVDEAGRGCLAGPVTAAAVILNCGQTIEGLDDSKKLDPLQREAARELIQQKVKAWAIGWASVEEIDQVNILQATFLAMQRAVAQLTVAPRHILVDGNKAPRFGDIPASAIIGGDARVAAISAASILAKTARDSLMQRWHHLYPEYQLSKHKGYPTKAHKEAIAAYGLTPLHRKTFRFSLEGGMKAQPNE